MDNTALFKACAKAIKARQRVPSESKTDILRKTNKDIQLVKAKEVGKQLKNLENFLQENKKAYLSFKSHLSSGPKLTEIDKNKIDENTQNILDLCGALLKMYKAEYEALSLHKQVEEHYVNIYKYLDNYLKNVKAIYNDQKALRLKRVLGGQKIAKLELRSNEKSNTTLNNPSNETKENYPNDRIQQSPILKPLVTTPVVEEQLTAEELQMFELENEHLFNELNAFSEEVQQLGKKVQHIAQLQEVFTEKVLEQEKDIERIATTVTGATENMKQGNEQIRQAIQRTAGLRVWVLFFILVMSFTLLFLNSYNS